MLQKLEDLPVHTTPNHYAPKMDILPETFLQIILAAKWLVRLSSTSPKNGSDDLCLLFCIYPSSMALIDYLYDSTQRFAKGTQTFLNQLKMYENEF